nr:transcription factor StrO [Stachybotrys sp.]
MAGFGDMAFDYPPTTPTTDTAQQRVRQQPGSACDECRRRKLRCDRMKPQCLACVNSGVTCTTRNDCAPRGPKKGHLNALRDKIAFLEARLNEQGKVPTPSREEAQNFDNEERRSDGDSIPQTSIIPVADAVADFNTISAWLGPVQPTKAPTDGSDEESHIAQFFSSLDSKPAFGLQLSPLVCSDLDQLYFDRVHPFAPLVQKFRYLTWARQVDKPKHKVCLQYAMWTLAASLSSQFQMMRRELYTETRRMLESLEAETQDTNIKCIEQLQAWMLLSYYELISDYYQRALVSAGRAFRLIQLMKLHEIDKHPSISLQSDWIDTESKRRTFWVAYNFDRFTSVVDGLSLAFNEAEIGTRLPAPESNFISGQPTVMCFLSEAIGGMDTGRPGSAMSGGEISPFAESAIMATICGRVLNLKRQPVVEYGTPTAAQAFYMQHASINALLMTRLQMLTRLIASVQGHPDSMLVFLATSAYMTIFMLCETVESRPSSGDSPHTVFTDNKQRSLDAARELGNLMAELAQLNYFETHPLAPIPLLLSARFCLSHIGLDDAYAALMPGIAAALWGLTNVNGLAQNFLRLLGLNVPNTFCPPVG